MGVEAVHTLTTPAELVMTVPEDDGNHVVTPEDDPHDAAFWEHELEANRDTVAC